MDSTIIYVQNSVLLKQKFPAFRNATGSTFLLSMQHFTEAEEEGGGWNINRAQWRAAPSTHCQPLLFLFSFFFCFVCCTHHCLKKTTRNRAQFTAAPSAHHRPASFPPPATALPLPLPLPFLLLLLLCILHSPVFEEEDQKQSTVHDSSLSSPPASAVSIASQSSFSSPSPSPSPSSFASYPLFTLHANSGELLHCSRSNPNLNARCLGPTQKKKIQKHFSDIVFYLKN